MKTKYRDFTIEQTRNGFLCEFINCFACQTQEQVERAIDRYIGLCWFCDPILTSWAQ